MIADLIESRILLDKSLDEVYSILGDEKLSHDKLLTYFIIEEHECDIDPVYYDHLIVEFDEKFVTDNVFVKRVY